MPKPTPMPEIEIGDWVLHDYRLDSRVDRVDAVSDLRFWFRDGHIGRFENVLEIRKADGRIWRREEPQR